MGEDITTVGADSEIRIAKTNADLPEERNESANTMPSRTSRTSKKRGIASKALASIDPLQAYLNEAKRYPLLNKDQEKALAKRYLEDNDLEAAKVLVTSNLRLVVKIAYEYRKAYQNVLDLIQEGNVGLMQAVKKFDPYRGVKLSTYASWWIKAYILKYILNNWRLVKIGTTQNQRKLFFNLHKEVDRMRKLGIEHPDTKAIAQSLDVPEDEVISMQGRLASRDMSLDVPVGNEETGTSGVDMLRDPDEQDPAKLVSDKTFAERIQAETDVFRQTLSGRDLEVFNLRSTADDPLTLQEIGNRYGITRERARQIERRILNKLRAHMEEHIGDVVNIALRD